MKRIFILIIFVLFTFISNYINHELRLFAQQNEQAYELMLYFDYFSFVCNGGGSWGYGNFYKWKYAKWINDSNRKNIEKFLFWNKGFFYDATSPPEKYPYPPKWKNIDI